MALRFPCPKCGYALSAPEDCAGRSSKCRACGQPVIVPAMPVPAPRSAPNPLPRPAPVPAVPVAIPVSGPAPNQPLGYLIPQLPIRRLRRLCTPSMLLFSICLLPLPFVEVNCSTTGQTYAKQSGLQTMYGGYSLSSLADKMPPRDLATAIQTMRVWPSLCMVLVLVAVLIAASLCLILQLGRTRCAVAGACVGASLLLILGQAAWGFPLENAVVAELSSSASRGVGSPRSFDATEMAALIQVRFTPWFHLWWLLIAGSLVPIAAEVLVRWSQGLRTTRDFLNGKAPAPPPVATAPVVQPVAIPLAPASRPSVWWPPRRVALAVGAAIVAVALLAIMSIVLLRTSGNPKDDMTWQELEDRLNAAGWKVHRTPSKHSDTMWYGERLPTQQFVKAYEEDGFSIRSLYAGGNVRVTRFSDAETAKLAVARTKDIYQDYNLAWGPFVFDGRKAVLDDVKKRLTK